MRKRDDHLFSLKDKHFKFSTSRGSTGEAGRSHKGNGENRVKIDMAAGSEELYKKERVRMSRENLDLL